MKSFVLVFISLAILFACDSGSQKETQGQDDLAELELNQESFIDEHNAQNSLDWAGVYEGTIPCADCPGIKISLRLYYDNTFSERLEPLESEEESFYSEGAIEWAENGMNITLKTTEGEISQYRVIENSVIRLDAEGNEVTGELASDYILKKMDD